MHLQIGFGNGAWQSICENLKGTRYHSPWIHVFQLRKIINNPEKFILWKVPKLGLILGLPENTKIGSKKYYLQNLQINKYLVPLGSF